MSEGRAVSGACKYCNSANSNCNSSKIYNVDGHLNTPLCSMMCSWRSKSSADDQLFAEAQLLE